MILYIEREAFEKWAKTEGYSVKTYRYKDYYYTEDRTNIAFKAWNAKSLWDNEQIANVGEGKYAIYFQDNWDNTKDKYWTIAIKENGIWKSYETHNDLIQYEGDRILRIVPLFK